MTNRYMTLTLGRDLCYVGTKASALSALEAFVKSREVSVDGGDSVICYSADNGVLTPRAIGIALEDIARYRDFDEIDTFAPPDEPGGFRLPPGKYGFVQLESDADRVIEGERLELLEYMNEKQLKGDMEHFYLRTISEEEKDVYQILIPISGD